MNCCFKFSDRLGLACQGVFLVQDNDYQAAAAMAFELGHAGQLRSVVEAACAQGQEAAEDILNALVGGFEKDQIKQCLEFIREWNTNSRHCHAAQATLQAILSQHAPEVHSPHFVTLFRFNSCREVIVAQQQAVRCARCPVCNVSSLRCQGMLQVLLDIPGVAALLDGLSAYTQRHMARIDRLRRSVALLDYTLGAMRVVAPQEAASAQEAAVQPQPALGAPAPAAAAQPMAVDEEDSEPHSSESDLTAATGLERPVGDDEDDIDLEEIDIRSIERAQMAQRSPRAVADAANLADEADSRDRGQDSAAGASTTPGTPGREAAHGRKKRRTSMQMVSQGEEAAAASADVDDAQGTQSNGTEGGDQTDIQHDKQQKKKHKKQNGAKTSILKRPVTRAAAKQKNS